MAEITTKRIDPATSTLKTAEEIAALLLDAFAHDELYHVIWGKDYTFSRPFSDNQAKRYNTLQKLEAWRILARLYDPRLHHMAAYDGSKIVGLAVWSPPRNRRPSEGIWSKIRRNCATAIFKILNFWHFGWGRSPAVSPKSVLSFFVRGRAAAGIPLEKYSDEYQRKLAHYSTDELKKSRYPGHAYHWCSLMAVHVDYQRRGIGSKVFMAGAESLTKSGPIFTDGTFSIEAPPKYGLTASRDGQKLYESLGFEVKSVNEDSIDGIFIHNPLMEHNGVFPDKDKAGGAMPDGRVDNPN